MTDIPYGDCFTVDSRWDIMPLGGDVSRAPSPPPPQLQHSKSSVPASTAAAAGAGPAAKRSAASVPAFGNSAGASSAAAMALELPQQPQQVQVNITLRVPFSRSCLFKRVIEGGVMKQFKDTHVALMDELRSAMAVVVADKQPVQLGSPVGGGGGGGGVSGSFLQPLHASDDGALLRSSSVRNSGSVIQGGLLRSTPSFAHMVAGSGDSVGGGGGNASSPHGMYGSVGARSGGRFSRLVARDKLRSTVSSVAGDLWSVVRDAGVTGPQLVLTVMSFLVLALQLVLLFRGSGSTVAAPRPETAGSGGIYAPMAGSSSGFGAPQDLWAQRAEVLRAELELMRSHMAVVSEHLQLALTQAGAICGGDGETAG